MSLLFSGDFANPDTPLWLSAYNPAITPTNLQLSTLSVSAQGGIVMASAGQNYPLTAGAPIAFNRQDNLGSSATELRQAPSKQVPTKAVETTYLASVSQGGAAYDDLALNGLQIYGTQVVQPSGNSGCAGYLTKGDLPFSVELYTGKFTTGNIVATNVNASVGTFSTINVSTGSATIPSVLNVSTLNASTIYGGSGFYSTLSSQIGYISSLNADNINTSTLSVSTLNLGGNITVSSINAGIGTFSTLNAPGYTGSTITTSSITTSSITTGLLSTTVGVIKEVFTSTMTFNATVSPNFDLGLGGLIGGVAGGFAANGLALGLGGAALATGIASIAIARTSGGIHPDVFQTVNGTSQLQFSTIGISTTGTIFSKFVDTDSFDPQHVPGFPVITQTAIPAGTYCMRTVSDPLNLANSSGIAGQGIQGFSEWTPVYPGPLQVQSNAISSILTGNSLNLGTFFGDNIHVKPAPGKSIYLEGPTIISTSLITQGSINATSLVAPSITGSIGSLSTLNVSTFAIGNVQYQNFTASTVTTSTLNTTGVINYNSLQPITPGTAIIQTAQLNATSGVATNQLTCNGTGIFTSTLQVPALLAVSSVNGSVYPPVIPPASAAPTASIIMYVGTTAPAGWVFCIGTAYSQTDPLYAPLFAVIGLQFSGGIPGPTFRVPDLRGRTTFGASLQSYGNATTPFQITAIDFAALAVSYPGLGVPNNTNPNGLQALGMSAIAVGFDIVKGMVITNTVTGDVRTIIDIVNYQGGNFVNGFIGTYPNYPVLILSSALSVTTGSFGQVFNVNPGGAGFYLGNAFPPVAGQTNMITQTPYQVATHTHPQAAGAGGGVPTSGSANPIQGANTGEINQNYFYSLPGGGTSTLPAVMQVVPNNLAVNYIIKL